MFNQQLKNLLSYLAGLSPFMKAVFLLPIVFIAVILFIDDSEEYARSGNSSYSSASNLAQCASGSRSGESGATYGETSQDGIKYNVRTPSNYDATIAHPLLMVYAPAGANRARTEKLTNLTYKATSAGFIVAYADHPELSSSTSVQLGRIPGLISKKWCIDQDRIYLTGHSDGGSVSMALAFMKGTRHIPSAIAPSAAGISYRDLKDRNCPEPISVMVMHSLNDRHFPNFGKQSSGWWAACNQCGPIPKKLENGCIAYPECANGTKTWYCEGNKAHSKWPAINKTLIEFFTSETPRL